MNCGSERLPDTADRGLRQPALGGHGRPRPVGGVLGGPFQGGDDQVLDLLVADLPWGAGALLVGQALQPAGDEPSPPLAHGLRPHPDLGGDLLVRLPVRAAEDDPAALRQRLRGLGPPCPADQRLAFLIRQR
jgi:hypothetical protein